MQIFLQENPTVKICDFVTIRTKVMNAKRSREAKIKKLCCGKN